MKKLHLKINSLFLWLAAGLLTSAFVPLVSTAAPARPGLKICVASDAPQPVRQAAQDVLAAVKTHPLLAVFSATAQPTQLTDSRTLLAAANAGGAYDHLVVIGLMDDPLVQAVWQREARAEAGGIYVFGFGHLAGDIGYIESDRNPFLHGRGIRTAPFETEVVTITGTTPAALALATAAFLKQGLCNGLVSAAGWKRPDSSLLDRDPLLPDFALPDWLPSHAGKAVQVGLSQAAEDEYRGVLEDTGTQPREIWRVKYHLPRAWDGPGSNNAMANYANGLHRRAYGNTLWCARFKSSAEAKDAAPRIAASAKLHPTKAGSWLGPQPPYGPEKQSPGTISLWQRDEWLLMCTLPEADATELRNTTAKR